MSTDIKNQELTKEQEAKLPEYRERWTRIGLSTGSADFEKAKDCIIRGYQVVNEKPPVEFYLNDSPIHAVVQATLCKRREPYNTEIPTMEYVDALPSGELLETLNESIYGNHDAHWLGFYDFFRTELDIALEDAVPLTELAEVSGWVLPYENVAFIQHRPDIISLDEQEVLHNEPGPAVAYRDGLSIYAWHGQVVPENWIMEKDKLDPNIALTHNDMDMRSVAAEIIGWDKVLEQPSLNKIVIDKDVDPTVGTLIQVDLPDSGGDRFLIVSGGENDPREFALQVSPDVMTAREAQMNDVWSGLKTFQLEYQS